MLDPLSPFDNFHQISRRATATREYERALLDFPSRNHPCSDRHWCSARRCVVASRAPPPVGARVCESGDRRV